MHRSSPTPNYQSCIVAGRKASLIQVSYIRNIKLVLIWQYVNVRENRRGNQEWTIQRNWQHWVHKTQEVDNQTKNNKTQHREKKQWATRTPPKSARGGWTQKPVKGKQFLPFIRDLQCYSYSQYMLDTIMSLSYCDNYR